MSKLEKKKLNLKYLIARALVEVIEKADFNYVSLEQVVKYGLEVERFFSKINMPLSVMINGALIVDCLRENKKYFKTEANGFKLQPGVSVLTIKKDILSELPKEVLNVLNNEKTLSELYDYQEHYQSM